MPLRNVAKLPTENLLSVVVPLKNEADVVARLHERLGRVLDRIDLPAEILYVNDGSDDETRPILDDLAASDDRVIALHLSRNFGHQAAVTAGLDRAQGAAVIVMDGDLQDPPELIPSLLDAWQSGADVAYAVRQRRQEAWPLRLGYSAFYRVQRLIGDLPIPADAGDFCLMDRRVVDALAAMPERARFVRGLRSYVGFRQVGVVYDRPARAAGRSKYGLAQLTGLATDGLVSFSAAPLRLATRLGLVTVLIALGLTIWALGDALLTRTAPAGWASLVIVVLFLGAVQLISLGIVGEYIRLIFLEVKGRPTYIVADEVSGSTSSLESDHLRSLRSKSNKGRDQSGLAA